MAIPSATPKPTCHSRSISLPFRSHPLTASVEEHVYRLRASESASSSSPSAICRDLGGLRDLFECVEDMLQLSLIQQVLSHELQDKWVEEVMDGSLRLLDICGMTRDALSMMKEGVQELESSLRRKRGGECDLANEVGNYMRSRRNLNKVVGKCVKDLKRKEKKCNSMLLDKPHDLVVMISMLREVEAISLKVFGSLLSFVFQPKATSKPSRWSLVSKLMRSKHTSCEKEEEEEENTKEVEMINAAFEALNGQKLSKVMDVVQVQIMQKRLETLESSMQELEEGLESVFRLLLKNRVSLLNILNH